MDPVQPEASVVQTGLGLKYIGEHAFGYSGTVSVSDSELDLLSFDSGSGYIVAKIMFNYAAESSNNFTYRIRINGEVVQLYIVDHTLQYTEPDNTIHLIIPPFTTVRCTAKNDTGDSGRLQICSLIGRVYGAK